MKATKPQLRPLRRWSSSRGHMIFTLAMPPKRTNSLFSICRYQHRVNRPSEEGTL